MGRFFTAVLILIRRDLVESLRLGISGGGSISQQIEAIMLREAQDKRERRLKDAHKYRLNDFSVIQCVRVWKLC